MVTARLALFVSVIPFVNVLLLFRVDTMGNAQCHHGYYFFKVSPSARVGG